VAPFNGSHGIPAASLAGVRLTHPTREVYAELGVTKLELAEYYVDIAEQILPGIRGRPLSIMRCPRGQGEPCFYQKHFDNLTLAGIDVVQIRETQGVGAYATLKGITGLVQLVQLGALELHQWSAVHARLDRPDQLVVDLDPAPEVPWSRLRSAAREVRERLLEVGLVSFVRTTGGKGLHVVAPLEPKYSWEEVRRVAHAIAEAMQTDSPEAFIATSDKSRRDGKIFVDYLRNARGATAIANYSTRARKNAPVATPLAWDELGRISSPEHFRLGNIRRRLARLSDSPWAEFGELKQRVVA
jgi:bifunctional non-homologous end joining protein LigD